jgi:hypothetical protein
MQRSTRWACPVQAHAEALRLAEPQEVHLSSNEQRLLFLVCVVVPGISVAVGMHLFVPYVRVPQMNGILSTMGREEWRDATFA